MQMRWGLNLCRKCYSTISRNISSSDSSTIYAVATGGVRSALSVIRVSGPKTFSVVENLGRYSRESKHKFPKPRVATLRKLYDPKTTRLLDHGIVLWFPGPHSYTGEDCCEFHIHGGTAVMTGMLKAIGSINGCRMAEPGEFTKRSFLNGKMDLTEVDAVADLIAAETEFQRIQALNQMNGSLSKIYYGWRNRLAKCLANSEAFIDFGEDENIESEVMENVVVEVIKLVKEISNHLEDQKRGQRLRDGVRVAIVGEPNVGKSTLLNKLCGREAAIVSSIPGTTRDVIENCVNIQGFPVLFCDTAGIRNSSSDVIENEGIKRSVKEIQAADLILLLIDVSKLNSQLLNNHSKSNVTNLIEKLFLDLIPNNFPSPQNILVQQWSQKTILIVNKVDLSMDEHSEDNIALTNIDFDCKISCKTGMGMEQMHQLIRKSIVKICGDPSTDPPHVTQERYRMELNICMEFLVAFLEFTDSDLGLRTQHLKQGINALGRITGHVGTEEILDIIFRDFCIGK